MTATTDPTKFYGWRVVAAAFVLAVFGWGLGFYGPPVYLHAVREARGWSLALVSTAVTVHFLVGALIVANLPKLHARFGLPRMTKAGAVILGIGVTGWAMAELPWQLFAATLLSGAGWATCGAAAVNAIIAPWFARTRPAALAMAYNGASIGGVIFSPLWVFAISELGFPLAAGLIATIMIVIVWVLADVVFAQTPERLGQRPDGDSVHDDGKAPVAVTAPTAAPLPGGQLWRDLRFLTLAAGMALGLFAQVGLLAHLFSLLVPPLGAQMAGLVMGGATAAAVTGRTLVGWLMPAGADRRLIVATALAVQIAGAVALVLADGSDVLLLLLGVLLFGSGIGNITSLPPLIAQVEFVRADVPRVVALIVALAQAGYAFAPAVFGLIRDLAPVTIGATTTSAAPSLFIAAAIIQLLSITAYLTGRTRR
jgi:MFS family permease